MSYEVTTSGAHRFACDVPHCPGELLAPDEPELQQDAQAMGWFRVEAGDVCPSCMRGIHAGGAQMRAFLASIGLKGDEVLIQAPGPVSAGDPYMHDVDGVMTEVATFLEPGGQGDQVRAKLKFPEVQARVAPSPQLAAVVGAAVPVGGAPAAGMRPSAVPGPYEKYDYSPSKHEDDLFDAFGELPERAPRPAPAQVPYDPNKLDPEQEWRRDPKQARPGSLGAAAGTDGGAGIVQAPKDLDPGKVAKAKRRAPLPPPPKRTPEELVAASDLFGFLTSDKNGYTPDDK